MKHIIITGGSRGLGLAFVRHCVSLGYAVSSCSSAPSDTVEELSSAYPAQFFWQKADLAVSGEGEAFVDAAMKHFADLPLWALVNNAGIAHDGVLATLPMIEVQRVIAVNLVSSIGVARACLRYFLKQNSGGRIVNISSIIGARGYTGLAAYSASKAGLDGLTRALAREVGRRNICVNSLAPGYLDTEMSSTLGDEKRDQIIRRTPMHRLGQVGDVVPVLDFLLSDASAFMTGQTLIVDGGITC
jgi:3-oxoacyl-[acyl-carrier protein] reductase